MNNVVFKRELVDLKSKIDKVNSENCKICLFQTVKLSKLVSPFVTNFAVSLSLSGNDILYINCDDKNKYSHKVFDFDENQADRKIIEIKKDLSFTDFGKSGLDNYDDLQLLIENSQDHYKYIVIQLSSDLNFELQRWLQAFRPVNILLMNKGFVSKSKFNHVINAYRENHITADGVVVLQ